MSILLYKNNALACLGSLCGVLGIGWAFGTQTFGQQLGFPRLTSLETYMIRNVAGVNGLFAYLCYASRKSGSVEFKDAILKALLILEVLVSLHTQYAYSVNGMFSKGFYFAQAVNVAICAWCFGALKNNK